MTDTQSDSSADSGAISDVANMAGGALSEMFGSEDGEDTSTDALLSEALESTGEPTKGEPEDAASEAPDAVQTDSEEVVDDTEAETEEEEAPKAGSGAQKRIQQLVAQKRELEEKSATERAQLAQYVQSLQQQVQQQSQARETEFATLVKQQHEQIALLTQQLQQISGKRQEEDDRNLSEVERFKKNVLREAESSVEKKFTGKFEELQKQFTDLQKQRESEAKAAQERLALQRLYADVAKSRTEHFFKDYDIKSVPVEVQKVTDDMITALCAARNVPAADAAKWLHGLVEKMAEKKIAGGGAAKVAKRPAGTGLPQGGTGTAAKNGGRPSWDALKAAGYKNYLRWTEAGKPALQEPKSK